MSRLTADHRERRAAPRIALVAGEPSGDLLGALLIEAMQTAGLGGECYGIAGPKMQGRGANSLYPMEALSVRGYVEALAGLPRILSIRRGLRRQLLADPPALFIGIDAPDFNLSLEADLKRAGVPTVHFISPSIWAWRRERIDKIRRAVAHMLLVFPFEEAIYREAGVPATYVGHPLARLLPEQPDRAGARRRLGLDEERRYVALLPGSRRGELRQHAQLYLDAARRLATRHPDVEFLVPLATPETEALFTAAQSTAGPDLPPLHVFEGRGHDVLQAADSALVASGTATLEAALLDCPHVIAYRVPRLTYALMMRQAYLPWIGLPNILAGRTIVRELVQREATADRLADAVSELLERPATTAAMRTDFAEIRQTLRRDTPRLIADALRPFLARTDVAAVSPS